MDEKSTAFLEEKEVKLLWAISTRDTMQTMATTERKSSRTLSQRTERTTMENLARDRASARTRAARLQEARLPVRTERLQGLSWAGCRLGLSVTTKSRSECQPR